MLRSKQAIVIGPTPPGTGVIAPATARTAVKSTSPTTRLRPSASAIGLMPTSITVAPGLTQSAPTIFGWPVAAIRMSARRQISAASRAFRVGHGYRAIGGEEQSRDRFPDNVRSAEDRRLGSPQVLMNRVDQSQAALRGARYQALEATPQSSDIDRMEAVDILCGVDRGDDPVWFDLARQWKLNQDPVDTVVAVELLDLGNETRLRDVARQADVEDGEAGTGAGAAFGADINLARRIVTDQDCGKAWSDRPLVVQARCDLGGTLPQCGSECTALDHLPVPHLALLLDRRTSNTT